MKHYLVTMEQMNRSRRIVISEPTESNTNRRIIVPVNDCEQFLDRIEHILSINLPTKNMNKANNFGLYKPLITFTEDHRSYYYIIYVEAGIYYVTIYEKPIGSHTFVNIDFLSLKSVGVVIKYILLHYRTILEDSSKSIRSNLETSDSSSHDSLTGNRFISGEDASDTLNSGRVANLDLFHQL
ncbi:hypothetical protein RF11_10912 [Thelohanellus kitauei]|uniref:Uncharacterized protein n=1 Tax=Thelohanellus kitauei TaxID=669202 RepID=A0A0C2J8M3_THEKT|nr:hypothetical protein RF11_10912 [Thelohanellus kitauei]